MTQLSIILVTFNSSSYVKECISSLVDHYKSELEKGIFEIIVFDNNSTDNTIEKVNEATSTIKKSVRLISNKENFGFAKGVNAASAHAKGETLLFLNPDSQVLDNNILKMMEKISEEKVGVVGGRMISRDGKDEISAGKDLGLMHILAIAFGLDETLGYRLSPGKESEVGFVSGGFLMARKKVFEEIGGFNEKYFMYFEDVDLCKRLSDEGYKILFLPYAKIKHYGQGSSSRGFAIIQIYKGLAIYSRMYLNSFERSLALLTLKCKAIMIIMFGTILGKKEIVSTYKKAFSALSI